MNIQSVTRDALVRQIALDLGVRDNSRMALAIAAVSEHLRATCTLLASHSVASTIQTCRRVHRSLEPVFPEFLAETVVSDELANLHSLGDVIKLDAYRALIGPGRLVVIDDSKSLLLGAGSIWSFPRTFRKSLEVAGRSRVVGNDSAVDTELSLPVQRLEDWLELDQDDMLAWAAQFIHTQVRNEKNIELQDGLTIWFGHRWIPLNEARAQSDVYLSRRTTYLYGNATYEYHLLRIRFSEKGEIKVDAKLLVEKDIARKLQGAMRPGGLPAEKIKYSFVRDGIVEVTVRHPLPNAFSKILLLGWESTVHPEGSPWPKRVEFTKSLMPLLARAFHSFGYEFEERREK